MTYYTIGQNYLISSIHLDVDNLFNSNNFNDFMRGYIENYSELVKPDFNNFKNSDEVILDIYFIEDDYFIIEYIKQNWNISCELTNCILQKNNIKYNYMLQFKFINVLDILAKVYYPGVSESEVDEEIYNEYMTLSNYQHIYYDCENDNLHYRLPKSTFILNDVNAVKPTKSRASDVGYDLTIIKSSKRITENIIMFDTGVIVTPSYGFYFEIVPRSSLSKSGYMLANSIGIIDPSYQGTLKIVLIKIDDELPDIELPFKCCQLILRKMIHYELNEVSKDNLIETNRSSGGFGSTNKIKN